MSLIINSDAPIPSTHDDLLDSRLQLVPAFYALQILGGFLGLGVLLFTIAFARSVKRHATVVNLLLAWVLSTVANCLLLFGGVPTQPDPPLNLCLSQAAILHGVSPMLASALLAAMIQIWLMLRTYVGYKGRPDGRWNNTHTAILLAVPYVVFIAWMAPSYAVGASNHDAITRHREGFFCSINPPAISDYAAAFSGAVLLLTVLFGVFVAATLFLNWRAVYNFNEGGVDIQLIYRVGAFAVYDLFGAIASLMTINSPQLVTARHIFTATIPLAAFLIFASQPDILRAWFLLRPSPPADGLLSDGAEKDPQNSAALSVGAATPFRRDFDTGYEEAAWSPWRLPPAPYVTSPRSRDRDSLPPSQRDDLESATAGGNNDRSRYGAVRSGKTPLKHSQSATRSSSGSGEGSGSGTKSDLATGIEADDHAGARTLDTPAAQHPPGMEGESGYVKGAVTEGSKYDEKWGL